MKDAITNSARKRCRSSDDSPATQGADDEASSSSAGNSHAPPTTRPATEADRADTDCPPHIVDSLLSHEE
jgi:hypothetical protein